MSVLDKICTDKQLHIDVKKRQLAQSDLEIFIQEQEPPRGFIKALKDKAPNQIALIAEVKKASPSRGTIREDFDPVNVAAIYQENGAACLSVLTDEPYFQGHDSYFTNIRKSVSLPMLRKDFMLDPYQIYESRALGADCILLIMACLSDAQAGEMYDLSKSLTMDVLVEIHDEDELDRARQINPQMIGVNNRNLKTLDVDLQSGLNLAQKIPDEIFKIAESGISTSQDIQKFLGVGYGAFLIGESLIRQKDIGAAVKNFLQAK